MPFVIHWMLPGIALFALVTTAPRVRTRASRPAQDARRDGARPRV
ncbi:hypothetical protein [Streptomyces sp. NPDC095613]